ncbi:hypothetical protein G3O08_00025 [Cryomorpha ignava]|uniref:Capsule assembly Wzi family protein n=1 Tax=Cryomorpha ignava TaxID=101383 RepID=A0A7K3WJT4_9FLAO|nr:DUF6029 family protein [Cryomorpha ignava]NEN21889.1 hypothetical protein [Cryomorpha ignava]
MLRFFGLLSGLLILNLSGQAQDWISKGEVSGNFQLDGQYYVEDSAISAVVPPEIMALSGFGNIIYRNAKFSTGLRFETYLPAPVAYPAGAPWNGTGIGYRFARYSGDEIDITVGNFYEQFGSGMILRTWEDRGLGVDYSLDGIRVKARPYKGIELTGLYGKQRFNFNNGFQNGDGIVRGLNGDFNLSELLDSTVTIPGQLSIGGSYVSRYEKNLSNTYDFPENVDGGAARLRYNLGGFQFSGEYAWTGLNPTATNAQIINIPDSLDPSVGLWHRGEGVNLNATYSVRGFGVSVTASSLASMAYQSQRASGPFDSWINYLPATSVLQTYALSQLYPYATQPNGENAYRADVFYNFNRKSTLGGKYGMKLELSYTHIMSPSINPINDLSTTRQGADFTLFKPGNELYYTDFNARITKKLSKKFKGTLFYQNIAYNNDIIKGAYDYNNVATKGTVYSDLFVFEGNVKLNSKHNIRFEAQALFTDQHVQDWVAGVIEYTVSPHYFVTVVDQWNYGNADGDKFHFPSLSIGYIQKTTRVSMTYGRQRAGVFCVGGICRVVPASNGLAISITSSF